METKVVIGLGWGDEGKGITTDYLCQKNHSSKIVVRFSGGQQAGHNVVIDGVSHVHSNYGSGTLRGVPSYFSEHCTIYPLTMWREKKILKDKGITPKLVIHPLAMVTTPFDVAYNRITERKLCHGSCGLGISATIKRNENTGYKLYAIDLGNQDLLFPKLQNIFEYYKSLFTDPDEKEEFIKESLIEFGLFKDAIEDLYFNIQPYDYLENFDEVIFEGSQGVLLDMNHGVFPNVTHANTTSKNAIEICDKVGLPYPEIYYVTRCYQTRHGNGWMSNDTQIDLINNHHEINVFNDWQKDFKVAEIDYELLNYSLKIDDIYSSGKNMNKFLVVTCLDQRPDFIFRKDKIRVDLKDIIYSYSPESKNFQDQKNHETIFLDRDIS